MMFRFASAWRQHFLLTGLLGIAIAVACSDLQGATIYFSQDGFRARLFSFDSETGEQTGDFGSPFGDFVGTNSAHLEFAPSGELYGVSNEKFGGLIPSHRTSH